MPSRNDCLVILRRGHVRHALCTTRCRQLPAKPVLRLGQSRLSRLKGGTATSVEPVREKWGFGVAKLVDGCGDGDRRDDIRAIICDIYFRL